MSADRPPLAVVCDRVAVKPLCPIPGASKVVCKACEAPCWISPSSLKVMQRTDGAVAVCVVCWKDRGWDKATPTFVTPEGVAEARAAFRKRMAERN